MNKKLGSGLIMITAIVFLLQACRKKDAPLPDNLVQFEAKEQGISGSENSITIKIKLSRSATADVPVVVAIAHGGDLKSENYSTAPAVGLEGQDAFKINTVIPSGASETSIVVNKKAALFYGTEKLILTLYSSGAGVIIGQQKEFTLNFSEIVSTGSSLEIDGGGASFGNKVFLDLSANTQKAVLRTGWDLGFYTGSDFRVILNSSTGMMARPISKTDLNTVTAADTIGFANVMAFNFEPVSLPFIDYPTGDLTKTAIAEVAANANDNKVYIVNRGSARGWKKIKVIRNSSGGYTLQYADIDATTFKSVDVTKPANYFFKYISFDAEQIEVEPEAKKWDLAWTFFTNTTPLSPGVEIPYTFQDIILQNRNVETAIVLTSSKAYASFAETDLAGVTFNKSQIAIGADWRSGGGPSSAPAIKADRYYIIKDGENNIYKLRFTSLTKNGVRGYPSFEYALVKKG